MYEDIVVSVDEKGIASVVISRPKRLNAIRPETLDELLHAFRVTLGSRLDSIKAVILSSSGDKAFSSGLDLSSPSVRALLSPSDKSPGDRADELDSLIKRLQEPLMVISSFPRPVICAISGLCIGLGVDLASACDIRIASPSSVFSVREVKIGICADLGSLFFLPRVCSNDSWLREVCFTGRNFSAQEAFSKGLVGELADSPTARALALAVEIGENEPSAVSGTKTHLNFSSRRDMKKAMDFVAAWNSVKLQDTHSIARAIGKVFSPSSKL